MIAAFGHVRYLDVGAGTGRYAQALRAQGCDAVACEYSSIGRMIARRRGIPVQRFDLGSEPPTVPRGDFDVAFSLAVAEHLPAEMGDRLVEVLCAYSSVVFTAAHPGQGGTGHVNAQPKACGSSGSQPELLRSPALEQVMLDADGELVGRYLLDNFMTFTANASR